MEMGQGQLEEFGELLFSLRGRAGRAAYWTIWIVCASLIAFTWGLEKAAGSGRPVLYFIVSLLFLFPNLALQVKRLHDRNRSGWCVVLGLVPIVNIWYAIEVLIMPGTPAENRFGEPPTAVVDVKTFLGFFVVASAMSIAPAIFGCHMIQETNKSEIEFELSRNLAIAQQAYADEIHNMWTAMLVAGAGEERSLKTSAISEEIRESMGLFHGVHYLRYVAENDFDSLRSDLARRVARHERFDTSPSYETRIVSADELSTLKKGDLTPCLSNVLNSAATARAGTAAVGDSVMAMECAVPVCGQDSPHAGEPGRVKGILYGGRIINGNGGLVSEIHERMFPNGEYRAMPVTILSIFQKDTPICTNVPDDDRKPAVGMLAAKQVCERIYHYWLEGDQDQRCQDRCSIAGHQYTVMYAPIDRYASSRYGRPVCYGEPVGMLCVGLLDEAVKDRMGQRQGILAFLASVGAATFLGLLVCLVLKFDLRPVVGKTSDRGT